MFIDAFINIFDIIRNGSNDFYAIVLNSLKVSTLATVLAAFAGIISGTLLYLFNFKGKRIILLLLNTALSLPTVVVGLFLYGLISRRGVLGGLGILYTQSAMVIGQVILIFPIVVTLTHSAINTLPVGIARTARALGAGTWQTSLLLMREARFGIIIAVIAALGRAISEVGVSMMLGGNIAGFTRNMTTAIALEHNKGNFALGLALGIILLIITFSINLILNYLQKQKRR